MLEKLSKRFVPYGRAHTRLRWPILGLLMLAWCLDCAWVFVRALGREIRAVGQEAAAHLRADLPQYRRHAPRRAMAAALALVLCLGMLPVNAFATEWQSTCPHDLGQHDASCGYAAAVEAKSCGHTTHDDTCGYAAAAPETPCDKSCADTDGDGAIDHAAGCAYTPATEGTPCKHTQGEHDAACGYAVAAPKRPASTSTTRAAAVCATCAEAHETADCPVEAVRALIAALPTPEDIKTMTTEAREESGAYDKMEAAYLAYDALTPAQKALLPDAMDAFTALQGALSAAPALLVNDGSWTYPTGPLNLNTAFAGGTGRSTDPYLISTAQQLANMSYYVNTTTSTGGASPDCYKLTADIDMGSTNWRPIGESNCKFTGTFDGGGYQVTYTISEAPSNGIGLFGYVEIGGVVKNVGTAGTVSGTDSSTDYVGGVAGSNAGTVQNCYNASTIIGTSTWILHVGGVVGRNYGGTVENCYNTGAVSVTGSSTYAGGVVGYNEMRNTDGVEYGGTVQNCYNTAAITGGSATGGVVGANGIKGTVGNCYNTGAVSGTGSSTNAGGVVGTTAGNDTSNKVQNCVSLGLSVSGGASATGRVAGKFGGKGVFNNKAREDLLVNDTVVSSNIATDKNGAAVALSETVSAVFSGWSGWSIPSGALKAGALPTLTGVGGTQNPTIELTPSYPTEKPDNSFGGGAGTADNPYQIAKPQDLLDLSWLVNNGQASGSYTLTGDIDLSKIPTWTPIGTAASTFNGTFDGGGHTVSGLNLGAGTQHSGLFGVLGIPGTVKNLAVSGAATPAAGTGISAVACVGLLAGQNKGSIYNCSAAGTLSAQNYTYAGGLVGENQGRTANCFSAATVTGVNELNCYVGGVVGYNSDFSNLQNVYHSGTVAGKDNYCGSVYGSHYNGTAKNVYGANEPLFGQKNSGTDCYATIGVDGALTNGTNVIGSATNLTAALNAWVETEDSTDYKTWVGTNPAAPVFGPFHVARATVSFNSNGGSDVASAKADSTGKIAAPTAPTRTGYTFGGWYEDNNTFANPWVFATDTATADITLYAKWTADTYTVSFDLNDGAGTTPVTQSVTYGEAYGTLPTPTRTGYVLTGWFTAAADGTRVTAATTVATASNHTLYAHWSEKAMVVLDLTTQTVTYDGTEKAFTLQGTNSGLSDFNISYSTANPTNAGSYDVTITRPEDTTYAAYNVTITGGLVIAQKPLTEAMLTITGSYTYTGTAITPNYTVTDGSALTADDYTARVTDNTNAGTNTAKVTITGKGNYTGEISKTFAIAKAPLTVTVKSPLTISKVYDGGTAVTTAVSDSLEVMGLQNGETATASGTWAYDNKNVGSSKTVNITGITITYGTATSSNYTYTQSTLTASGAIEHLTLTHNVSVTSTKAYDGTRTAAATGDLTNKITSDVVTLDKAFAFNSKDVSAANQITATTWRINGADKDNYTLPAFAAVTDGVSITAKEITVAAAARPGVTKVYDGNTSATVDPADYAISGTVSGETLALAGLTAAYNAAGVTAANKVTCTGFTLADGSGLAANYNLTTTTFEIAASITPKPYTALGFTITGVETSYAYTNAAITPIPEIRCGETLLVKGSDYTLAYTDNKAVGKNAKIKIAFTGNYSGNAEKTFEITYAALPGGTANTTVFADYDAISTTWSNRASGVTFTGNTGWTVSTDGAAFGAGVTFTDEGDGVSKPVYVKDSAGNIYITTVTYKLDKTAPKISAAARSAAWSSDNQTITLTASDALSGLAGYGLSKGENQQPTTWQESNVLTVTETGSYWAWAKDKAGNTTHFGQSFDQKIDRNAPVITLVDIPAANAQGWHTTAPTVTVSATDTESGGMQYSFDGGSHWQSTHSKAFENGTHLVTIWVQDAVYNTAKQEAFTLKVDTAIPAAPTVAGYVSGTWTAENVVFTLSHATLTTSGHAKYQVKIGAAEWADVTGTTVTHSENTVDAGVTYQFRSVNNAGTEGTPSASITVKRRALDAGTVLDNAANKYADADLALSGTPNAEGWYGTSPVTVTVTPKTEITVSESEKYPADTYYKLDNGVETKLTGSTILVTGDGTHTLVIWTKDAAGNETTHLTKTIKIDKTAPTITNVTTPSVNWGKENETIHFTAADTTSSVKTIVVKDGEGKDYPVTENKSFVVDKNDTYTITVTDHAGKQTTKTVVVSKIDKTAPVIALPIFDSAKWFGATEITATVTDMAGSGVATVTVSGGHFALATDMKDAGKFTATEPVGNAYTYTIAATDTVGNSDNKTVTIKIDLRIDEFMAQTKNLTENSDFSHLAGAKDWYDKQNRIVKNHIDANAAAKEKLENLNTWIEAKAEAAAGALSDKVTNADTLEEIAQAKKDFDSLPEAAQDSVSPATKNALNGKLDDAKKAQNAIDQLENAFKPGASYEEKQGAKDAYEKLTEDQKKLVPLVNKFMYDSIKADLAAIDGVLDKLNAIKKPYTPATKALITTAKDAYDALTPKQKAAFPIAEKAELDTLVTMRDHAQTVETAIESLGDTPALDVLQQIKADYNALTADEKSLVDGALKTALDKKYQGKLDEMTADDKAAAEFATRVEEIKNAPTTDKIEQLIKEHTALSEAAKGKLTEQTKTDCQKLIDDLAKAKKVIDKLNKIDLGTLAPEHLDEVKDALGKGNADGYDDLTSDQKKLVDEATGGKPGVLDQAVTEIADATDKVEKIPGHSEGNQNPDGTPKLDDCGNAGNEKPDGTGTGGHNYSDHRKAIEDAKIAYEKLSDAGRKLISDAAKNKINGEYKALMAYLEYVSTAKTATTTVEVAGLAENVQLPADSVTAGKILISVVMKDEKPAAMPPVPKGKGEALSVNVKLVAKIFADANDANPVATEPVQPKSGEKVLVKLLLPTGYQNDTLEIWHVKDSGSRSRIGNFWLVTESDGIYALFEVSSLSHFVLFAEQTPTTPPTGGGDVTPPAPKPDVPDTDNGSSTITPQCPKPGDKVTITPKPDEGYVVDKIIVTDQNGKEIPVRVNGDGSYSYTQPKGKVTVTVTFKPAPKDGQLLFTDVTESDWFYESVKYVYEQGLMNGTASDKFSPYMTTSRGMIVTILWRLEGEPGATAASPFADVAADSYCAKAVVWGAEHGIVKGYGNGNFGPNNPITREQLASILYRHAQVKGMDTTAKGNMTQFTDQPSSWAAESVQWAVGGGIISGKGNGILDPMGKATRAETAKILTNFAALPQK